MIATLKEIDYVIHLIKNKGDIHGFNYGDTRVILVLEITRLELSATKTISDFTLKAINEVKSMLSREYYLHDFPDIFESIQDCIRGLHPFNKNFYSADIGIIGFENERWCNYFGGSIHYLLDKINPSARLPEK